MHGAIWALPALGVTGVSPGRARARSCSKPAACASRGVRVPAPAAAPPLPRSGRRAPPRLPCRPRFPHDRHSSASFYGLGGDHAAPAGPRRTPHLNPPQGLGREKDVARKTTLPGPPRTAQPTVSKHAHVQASYEMARLGIEPRTPRFSGTGRWPRKGQESPASRLVDIPARSDSIPVISVSSVRVKDVADPPRPFHYASRPTVPLPLLRSLGTVESNRGNGRLLVAALQPSARTRVIRSSEQLDQLVAERRSGDSNAENHHRVHARHEPQRGQ